MNQSSLFHLLAIAGDRRTLDYVVGIASDNLHIGFGIMLRDDHHDPVQITALAAYAQQVSLPQNITLISNSLSLEGIPVVHYTGAQFHQEVMNWGARLSLGGQFGVSTHSCEEAVVAEQHGAHYVILSPIFPTQSKPGHPGLGLNYLKSTCASLPIPVFALGGINYDTAIRCLQAGAYGVAGISLFRPENQEELRKVITAIQGLYTVQHGSHGI